MSDDKKRDAVRGIVRELGAALDRANGKHTPGPWKFQRRQLKAEHLQPEFWVNEILATVGTIENATIAMVLDADSFEPSDSQLMCASPDLKKVADEALTVVKSLQLEDGLRGVVYEELDYIEGRLEAVLRKAEGK